MTYPGSLATRMLDDISVCVGCGLCLPHCPTFRVTGEEAQSPRGRIALIEASLEHRGPASDDTRQFLDSCVQCRGCEPACPSGVQYGRILDGRKVLDEASGSRAPVALRAFLFSVDRPLLISLIGWIGRWASSTPCVRALVPMRLRIAAGPARRGSKVRRRAENPDMWLFTGCVMDTWFRNAHRATIAILESSGRTVATPSTDGLCCGALHQHSGLHKGIESRASRVMDSMPGKAPIIVNSAGCGAMLKEYGDIIGTEDAVEFSERVVDIHEWISENIDVLKPAVPHRDRTTTSNSTFIVQEPCHLRHVQRISLADVLEKFVEVVRLDDDGLCCGAGGAYSLVQAEMARDIRARKIDAISRASKGSKPVLITANPGCHLHLASAGLDVGWSVEVVAEALGLGEKAK